MYFTQFQDPLDLNRIICYDPCTGAFLGNQSAATPKEIKEIVLKSKKAQKNYQQTSFETRRAILSTLLDWIITNQNTICRVAALDSGKTGTFICIHLKL
jgi:acyl-CoA reductase-like NAD-dependent aldehyde dehydrogenase